MYSSLSSKVIKLFNRIDGIPIGSDRSPLNFLVLKVIHLIDSGVTQGDIDLKRMLVGIDSIQKDYFLYKFKIF